MTKRPRGSVVKHYNNLSLAEKERHNRPQEPPTRCPTCLVAVHPDDLLAHVETRCEGRPDPHPRCKWVSWGGAIDLGLRKSTLRDLVAAGKIRTNVKDEQRGYLKRDVVLCVARIRKKKEGKLTKAAPKQYAKTMAKTLDERLAEYFEKVGGVASASRKLDIPMGTLRRAAGGEKIRPGTKLLIETRLGKAR